MSDLPRAVLASRDDDEARLVWADELLGRGDARGELVVAQCELAHLGRRDPRRPALEARVASLLAEHGRAWAAPVVAALGARGWRFRRGLVEHVELELRELVERGAALAAWGVRSARVTGVAGRVTELAACPHLALLEALDLSRAGLHNLDAARLVPALRGLRELELAGNDLDDVGVAELSALPLERLGLAGNVVHTEGARALASMPSLRDLDLTRVAEPPDWIGNHIGPAAVGVLARRPLRRLVLRGNPVGVDGAELFTGDAVLRELDLGRAEIGPSAAWALAASPALASLELLDLSENALGAAGARALAGSPFLPRGLTLLVPDTGLTVDDHALLAARFEEVLS